MRKFLAGVALLAFVGCAQVSQDEYIRQYGQYARSDGIFQHKDTKGLDAVIDGQRLNSLTKCIYEDFTEYGDGDDWCIQSDYTACSGTSGEVDLIVLPSGNVMAAQQLGTQTIVGAVDMDAGSLDISGDQTNNDGVELVWGLYGASGGSFTVGDDPAFYTCAKVTIADASGTDEFHVGFRQAIDATATAGFTTAFDDYYDVASIGIVGEANPNNIYISTIAANGGTTDTDTTMNWADGETKTLCVYVSAAGVATFTVNSRPPTTTYAYTFTDAESLVPFIWLEQANATQTGEVDLLEWEVGYATAPF